MAQHHIVEIRARGFRGEADDLAPGGAPLRSTLGGSLLAGTSILQIRPIIIDQQSERLDAREDWKIPDVAGAASSPSGKKQRAL